MSIKAVLFDLDGTLLPMDQEIFIKAYIGGLLNASAKRGYGAKEMSEAIMTGTAAMVKNRGELTNEEVFWQTMQHLLGDRILSDTDIFDEFYATEFQKIANLLGYEPKSAEAVRLVKSKGLVPVLATNPLFPTVATESRIRWAGLEPSDFRLFTTFETSHYCKPNPEYYREILKALRLSAKECLMVGNDAEEDMIAATLGMKVFLLTPCLINKSGADISSYPSGGFDELIEFINGIN